MIASLPPLVASYRPDTQLPLEQAISEYRELIALQKETVDGFLAETIPSISEAEAVLTAAEQEGVRIVLGLTVSDEDGRQLRSGESLANALVAIDRFSPLAVVINCSKPEVITEALAVLGESRFPFGAFANGFTSVDALEPGGVVDVLEARKDLGPEQYAAFAESWLDAGASVIGGCCEVGPDHIKALSTLLKSRGHEQLAWGDLAA
jgi:S-methylmethionine-dependent homocysteine/selenocysteine methylase